MTKPPDPVEDFLTAAAPRSGIRADRGEEAAYLRAIGQRIRAIRIQRGMTRRLLGELSGTTERYLHFIEAGTTNITLLMLRAIATALGTTPHDLLADRMEGEAALDRLLARLAPEQKQQAHALLARHFSTQAPPGRDGRIALIGLRGAGKTALGRRLAAARGVPFHALGIPAARAPAGATIAEVFAPHIRSGHHLPAQRRELERLKQLVAAPGGAVIAAGAGIVAAPGSFTLLLRHCRTVWLRASAGEHLARARLPRALAGARTAHADLTAILASQAATYARADFTLDTTGRGEEENFAALLRLLD